MRRWIESIKKRAGGSHNGAASVDGFTQLELLVIEGDDTGQRFTLDGDVMHVGRRPPDELVQREILLQDTTVSSRQAQIKRHDDGYHIIHYPTATNPTLINGEVARDSLLTVGSKIRIGRVVMLIKHSEDLETRSVPVITTEPVDRNSETLSPSKVQSKDLLANPPPVVSTTDGTITGMAGITFIGQLVVEQGSDSIGHSMFPIEARSMLLGRGDDCDIQILDAEISRVQAELVYEDGVSYLAQRSNTKSSKLNGKEISDRIRLNNGDIITLAERIQLRVELHEGDTTIAQSTSERSISGRNAGGASDSESEAESLQRVMEEKLRLDRTIEEQFTVQGSFLDVDVADSYGMKLGNATPERTIVSFERFRQFVANTVAAFSGQVLNSNGDELMCFFDSPVDAVKSGAALLTDLEKFNQEENLLAAPFRIRIGIHTGRSLVDLERGVAYSEILDVAGHLQKKAQTNHIVVSQDTLDQLPADLPFEYAGEIDNGIVFHTLTDPTSLNRG